MRILNEKLSVAELNGLAASGFGDMVKAVVDIDRELLAIDAQLHSDLEGLLLSEGSKQSNLWGVNLYPEAGEEDFIEYDSMINVRPSANNQSRGVENEAVRKRIIEVIAKWVTR